MAKTNTVCSMCGDVGFPDKLFHCARCRSRYQHSYCTNYYNEDPSEIAGVCDWCLSEERSTTGAKHGNHPKKLATKDHSLDQHAGSSEKVKPGDREDSGSRGKNGSSGSSSSPSTKSMGRRYKLLKDVLC